jgi:UDP-N-acetylmuramoyl-L-alanyl-D-glutamate--2,6-diaminopimelate ligase
MNFNELLALVSSANPPAVRIDSRLVEKDDIFVAIEGTYCDGRDFIEQAINKGAGFIVARPSSLINRPSSLVEVEDARQAAAKLAQAAAGYPAKKLINLAVTGTNGKTTVAFLVRSCIAKTGSKCGLIGTVIYDTCSGTTVDAPLTTPDCITIAQAQRQMLENGAKYMIIEASSHALSQDRLSQIDFRAAAFTNLTGDHLDYHGCEANYLDAKTKLFSALSADATAILNKESPHSKYIAERTEAKVVWYGIDDGKVNELERRSVEALNCKSNDSHKHINASTHLPLYNLTAHVKSMNVNGSVFVLSYNGREAIVKTPLLGRHNISNHLTAAGLCLAAGLDLQTIAEGLSSLKVIPGRLENVPWDGPFSVLVDFAHTDDALKNVLSTLKPLCKGQLRLVFGCGGDRDRTKRPRMAKVAEQLADFLVVTSDNPRTENPNDIIAEIVAGFEHTTHDASRITIEPDRKKAIELVLNSAREGDIILIAGKGHENYQIIGRQKHHFSDQEIAQKYIEERFGALR